MSVLVTQWNQEYLILRKTNGETQMKTKMVTYNYMRQRWEDESGHSYTDRNLEQFPTYFSIRIGLYKIIEFMTRDEYGYVAC